MIEIRERLWPDIPECVRIINSYREPPKKKRSAHNKRTWTSEEDAQVKQLRAEGKTYNEISRIMGIDRSNIMRRLQAIAEVERRGHEA